MNIPSSEGLIKTLLKRNKAKRFHLTLFPPSQTNTPPSLIYSFHLSQPFSLSYRSI